MSTHKCIDTICCVVLAVVLVLTAVFMNGEVFGIQTAKTILGYEAKLFDTSTVHTIFLLYTATASSAGGTGRFRSLNRTASWYGPAPSVAIRIRIR